MDDLADKIARRNDDYARAQWNEIWEPPTGERKRRIDRRAAWVVFFWLPVIALLYALFFKALGI